MTLHAMAALLGLMAMTVMVGAAESEPEGKPALPVEDFQARIYRTAYGEELVYRLHRPAVMQPDRRYPMVLFLHGAGERGRDNRRQLLHGVGDILRYARSHDQPVIILAPQCPEKMRWVNAPWAVPSHRMTEYPSYPMRLTMQLLEQLMQSLPVDTDRVYVCGLSMGGYGTWDLLQRKPDWFAAAIPVCGGGDEHYAARLIEVPIWAFHGADDPVVPPARTRRMIQAIRRAGGSPRYTEYPGVGHNAWTRTFQDEKVLEWLFSQRRSHRDQAGQ